MERLWEMHFRQMEGIATHIAYIGAGILVRMVGVSSRHPHLRGRGTKALSWPRRSQRNSLFRKNHREEFGRLGCASVIGHLVRAPRRLKKHLAGSIGSFFLP